MTRSGRKTALLYVNKTVVSVLGNLAVMVSAVTCSVEYQNGDHSLDVGFTRT